MCGQMEITIISHKDRIDSNGHFSKWKLHLNHNGEKTSAEKPNRLICAHLNINSSRHKSHLLVDSSFHKGQFQLHGYSEP